MIQVINLGAQWLFIELYGIAPNYLVKESKKAPQRNWWPSRILELSEMPTD